MGGDTKHRMSEILTTDADLMHGAPCFRGTRVPVRLLLDDLKSGYTVERFLAGCPTVSRERSNATLNWGNALLLNAPGLDRRVH